MMSGSDEAPRRLRVEAAVAVGVGGAALEVAALLARAFLGGMTPEGMCACGKDVLFRLRKVRRADVL